jgi:hypothetical protein
MQTRATVQQRAVEWHAYYWPCSEIWTGGVSILMATELCGLAYASYPHPGRVISKYECVELANQVYAADSSPKLVQKDCRDLDHKPALTSTALRAGHSIC